MAFAHYYTQYNAANFIMLSERLHELFKFYILSGKRRAPPEFELYEMIPTFQQGARTDRRALQSKFKSWAKRMCVENEKLKLVNSGKIIIPREQCNDLIMEFHSPDHNSVDCIAAKIQHTYTWTRKNFGMDRDTVIGVLYNNCKNEKCQAILHKHLSESFDTFPDMSPFIPTSNLNHSMFMMPNSLAFAPPYAFNWTPAMPMTPMFSPLGYFSSGLITPPPSVHHSTPKSSRSQPSRNGMPNFWTDPRNVNLDTSQLSRNYLTGSFSKPQSTFKVNVTSIKQVPPVKNSRNFKRPRNMHTYKKLLKISQSLPNDYPNILTTEKTKFLSVMELVPKSVCSSKILRKFDRERKYKNMITEYRLKYIVGKVLRDRNKLKKNQQNRRSYDRYLKVSNGRNFNLKPLLGEKGEPSISSQKGEIDNPICVQNTNYLQTQVVRSKSPETIDIASSDDDEKEAAINFQKNVKRFQNSETVTANTETKENKIPATVKPIKYVFRKENTNAVLGSKRNCYSYSQINEFSQSNKENTCVNNTNAAKGNESKPIDNSVLLKNSAAKGTIYLKDITSTFTSTLNRQPQTTKNTFLANKFVHIQPKDSSSRYKSFVVPISDENNKISTHTSAFSIHAPKPVEAVHSTSVGVLQSTSLINQNPLACPLNNLWPPEEVALNPQKDKSKLIQPTLAEQPELRKKCIVLHSNGQKILLVSEDHKLLQKQVNLQNAYAVGKERSNAITETSNRNVVASTLSSSSGPTEGRSTTIKDDTHLKNLEIVEKDQLRHRMNFESSRIARWMQAMKNTFPNPLQLGNNESFIKLRAQLDTGLSLVKEAKNSLLEMEKTENFEDLVSQALSKEFRKLVKKRMKSNSA